jgi:hypothetical protein
MAFFDSSLLSCQFWPFTDVLRRIWRFVTRKDANKGIADDARYKECGSDRRGERCQIIVWAAVSAALQSMQTARLPLQNYFGANAATIFSKHGSPRSGFQNGSSFK